MSYKRTKGKKFISAAVLAVSVYSSVLFTLGLILGYLGTRFIYSRYLKKGPLKEIYINFRGWKIHLHHWIIFTSFLLYLFLGNWQIESHKIFLGIICGIIVQDIFDFNNWHQIVMKQKSLA